MLKGTKWRFEISKDGSSIILSPRDMETFSEHSINRYAYPCVFAN